MKLPFNDAERLARSAIPVDRPVRMVLDTDTYNEIDDQFALLYAILSPARIRLEAVYAALFHNARSSSPADGMEKSYQEILKVLDYAHVKSQGFAFRGCPNPLKSLDSADSSPAVDDLIARAMASPEDDPLFVVGIGACTNMAAALVKAPEIAKCVVIVWLLGNAPFWHDNWEFNISQDPLGARVIYDSGAPVIQIPAFGVTNFLLTSVPELEFCLRGANRVCDYLVDNVRAYHDEHFAWSKAIWDVGAIGLLVNPDWAPRMTVPSPIIIDAGRAVRDPRRHMIQSVYEMNRDGIFRDLFMKLRSIKD